MSLPTRISALTLSTRRDSVVLNKPSLNFSSPDAQCFVTIIVGKTPSQARFCLHKHVAAYYSPDFFGKAFNSTMKEGLTQSMELDDVDVGVFGIFNNWLYTQKLEGEYGRNPSLFQYAKLWSLAQRFLIVGLPDECLQCIESVTNYCSDRLKEVPYILSALQKYAYLEAPEEVDSPLRKVVLEMTLHSTTTANVNEMLAGMPENMVLDFAKALVVHRDCLSGELGSSATRSTR